MTKKIFRYILLGLGFYAVLATCVILFYKDDPSTMNWQDRQSYNKRFIANLKLKEPKYFDSVIETLGAPDLTFAKKAFNDTFQILYYRTQHMKSDGITTVEECTGLMFKNNILIAWGPGADKAYESITQ
ncbi:DUF3192 domain-containing protein [Pseudoalteromonas denitrificans]|uniref:DUF3192 domain-containing protein n=1 Tax=Pseudoalteromonas denitrificans DSM 6059 TaxID=1123010 RepID=A0A1I1GTR4_9GAMM|nr:DUF3192 domain-containing protein [Pseudoalteromonas denitrificans]SFC15054.1 Protein of unknown function [Pseudoalteromonas denitrificans DSM 6059]